MLTGTTPTLGLAHGCTLRLDRVRIMGILNVTPDSFSDGGQHETPGAALEHAKAMIDDGADCLDIGGESTRPGSARVDAEAQCKRVIPAIEAIRRAGISVPISVDTTLSAVAKRAIEAGANAINDVSGGLEDAALLRVAAEHQAGLILMHRLSPPGSDSYSHQYASEPDYAADAGPDAERAIRAGVDPVVPAVRRLLAARAAAAVAAGVDAGSIMLDPGLGFGKTVSQNFAVMAALGRTGPLGFRDIAQPDGSAYPLLGAASRKSFLGKAAGVEEPAERTMASVAAALVMALGGVRLIRAHDVKAHREALAIAQCCMEV